MDIFTSKGKNTDPSVRDARNRRWIKLMWGTFCRFFVVALAIFFIMVYNGVIGYMPPVEEPQEPK